MRRVCILVASRAAAISSARAVTSWSGETNCRLFPAVFLFLLQHKDTAAAFTPFPLFRLWICGCLLASTMQNSSTVLWKAPIYHHGRIRCRLVVILHYRTHICVMQPERQHETTCFSFSSESGLSILKYVFSPTNSQTLWGRLSLS